MQRGARRRRLNGMSVIGWARTWWPAATVGAVGASCLGAAMVLPWSGWTAWGSGPLATGSGAPATYLLVGEDSAPWLAVILGLSWGVAVGALALRWRGGRIVAAAVSVVAVVVCPVLEGWAMRSMVRWWDGMDLITGRPVGGTEVMRPDVGFILASLAQVALLAVVLLAPARRARSQASAGAVG